MLPPEVRFLAATSIMVRGKIRATDMRGACRWDGGNSIWKKVLTNPLPAPQYVRERWDQNVQSLWDDGATRFDSPIAIWDYYDRKPWDAQTSAWDNGDSVFDAETSQAFTTWIVRRAARNDSNLRTAGGIAVCAYRFRPHVTPPTPAYEATKQRMRDAQNSFRADPSAARAYARSLPNPDRLSEYHRYIRWHLNNH
jgi:hypothetical protein